MYTIFRATNSDGYVERIHEGDYVLLSGGYFEKGSYARSMKKEEPTSIDVIADNVKRQMKCRYGSI